MENQNIRDSAFESVDAEDYGEENDERKQGDTALDLLEQQRVREQARLLQRFRELRQWQQQEQEQLMQQQHLQLQMLKGEQLRVQSVLASQRGAQWGDGRVSRPEIGHKSPPLVTPPRRSGLGRELTKTMMATAPPQASTDSGLVASMGDTLEPPQGSLPVPLLVPAPLDEDNYTNPDLFSNPGSHSDDLQAVEDRPPFSDMGSEVGSDFYLPPLPPEPKEKQPNIGASLNALQALMANTAPNLLQQLFGQLPAQQKALLLEQRQAAVQESASPTFSPVNPHSSSLPHHPLPSAPVGSSGPALSATLPHNFSMAFSQAGGGRQQSRPEGQQFPSHPQHPLVGQGHAQGQFQGRSQEQLQGFSQGERHSQYQGFSQGHSQGQYQGHSQGQYQGHSQGSSQRHSQGHSQGQYQGSSSQGQLQGRSQGSSQGQIQGHHLESSQGQRPQGVFVPTSIASSQGTRQPQLHNPAHGAAPSSHHHSVPLSSHLYGDHHHQQQQRQAAYPQQEHSQPASQQHKQPSKFVPFEPQVRTRVSWEDERTGVRGGGSTDSDEEEEEEEELEVTVKAAAQSPEDRPIKSGLQGRKTFEQLLEEQLADEARQIEEERKEKEEQKSGPVKRPFLRKGQGIARFSQPIKRPPPKRSSSGHKPETSRSSTMSSTAHKPETTSGAVAGGRYSGGAGGEGQRSGMYTKDRGTSSAKRATEKKRVSGGKKQLEDEDIPQPEKLKLIKRRSESGKKSQVMSGLHNAADHGRPSFSRPAESEETDEKDSIADDASFVASLKQREKTAPLEAEELDEFEALEDIADNMSLVSNSSVVQRLITPNKQRQKSAVSDLKTVLEKKKAAPSSPFERNTALRSLLSNIPNPASSQPLEPARTPTQDPQPDRRTNNLAEGHNAELADDRDSSSGERHTNAHAFRVNGNTDDASAFHGPKFTHNPSGLDFSKQFSLFSQPVSQSEDRVPSSPTKSMTRKVAPLQTRLKTANDTASLLQKLSAQAGFLSSGFSQDAWPGAANDGDDDDEGGVDNSLLSSSVSRPQPMVIGGARADDAHHRTSAQRSGGKVSDEDDDDDDNDDTLEGIDDDDNTLSEEDDLASGGQTSSDVNTENINNANNNNVNNNANNPHDDESDGFEDEEEWMTNAPQVTQAPPTQQAGSEEAGGTTPPTSKLMSRLFPKLKPKPTAVQQQQQQKIQMASSTNVGDGIQSKVLREKLAELEAEIEKFRTENAALERLRREREEGVSKLKEEIARFDQEKTEELRRLEDFKAQETKKLKHERKLFETYQKQVRAMPDKKEREEIDTLKRQLTDLQDEMRRKEGRWTSNVTRLKTRVTELEGENAEMREEMKMLERKRLEWMQARPANKPAVSQPTPSFKSAPRSSTPTNDNAGPSNGYQDNHTRSRPAAGPAGLSGAVTMTTQINGAGAAGKTSSGVGGQGAGGESMPRGQPVTPSMIEGISPAALNGSEGSESFLAEKTTAPVSRTVDRPAVDKGNGQYEVTQYSDGKEERVYGNGAREVLFANGTRKEISSQGQYFIVSFFNGDIKQVFPDQRVVYYYAESQTTHTTYPDKLEVLQFPNNQIEKHYPDGTHEITFPNQTVKYLFPNGTEESIFPDGTILRIDKTGEKVLEFPNGQREIHTQLHKRREYPDGTVKTLHNDGRQETRYATGRVRLKDKDGNIIMDNMY